MEEEIAKQLQEHLGTATWDELKIHLKDDRLILVAPGVDLLEVGAEIANDNVERIEALISDDKISKPSLEQMADWEKEDLKFLCLIVSPFVLIQHES